MSFKEYKIQGQTYKLSKTIVWCFVIIGLILSITSLAYNPSGVAKYYAECKISDCASSVTHACDCKNFFFNNSNYCGKDIPYEDSLCSTEWIANNNTLGTPPPFIISNLYILLGGSLILCLVINHFLYNKDFNFKEAFNFHGGE